MTSYTNIPNGSVAPGAIPSSTLVTALRDNPIAIAESEIGAPYSVYGWSAHDGGAVGTNTGVIYDGAVNGTVASVITADFIDGYQYRIVASELSATAVSDFSIDVFLETSGTYSAIASLAGVPLTEAVTLDTTIILPRFSTSWHMGPVNMWRPGGLLTTERWVLNVSPVQKISRFRLRYLSGNIDAGKVWLFRRRCFASG